MGVDIVEKIHHDVYPDIDPRGKLKGVAEGKVIVLTGASRGIGEAIAIAFAHAGAKGLVLAARSEKELDRVGGDVKKANPNTRVLKVRTDVTDEASVENLFKEAHKEFDDLDVLINNAGSLNSEKIANSKVGDWWLNWTVNIKGTYLPVQQFIQQTSLEGKTIINTSSIGALRRFPGLSSYQTTKLAIIRFTEFLNAELGKNGLRAFSYHPGGVMTELATAMPKELHHVLIDKPALAAGYTVWLTTPAADFLKGRYSSCVWDVNQLVAKKAEILKGSLLISGVTGLTAGPSEEGFGF